MHKHKLPTCSGVKRELPTSDNSWTPMWSLCWCCLLRDKPAEGTGSPLPAYKLAWLWVPAIGVGTIELARRMAIRKDSDRAAILARMARENPRRPNATWLQFVGKRLYGLLILIIMITYWIRTFIYQFSKIIINI